MSDFLTQKIGNPVISGSSANMSGEEFFSKLIGAIIALVFVMGIVIFMFMLLSGGITWITSGGDKAKLEKAQQTVINAVVGLIVLLLVYGIVNFIENFIGFNLTTFDIGSLGL